MMKWKDVVGWDCGYVYGRTKENHEKHRSVESVSGPESNPEPTEHGTGVLNIWSWRLETSEDN